MSEQNPSPIEIVDEQLKKLRETRAEFVARREHLVEVRDDAIKGLEEVDAALETIDGILAAQRVSCIEDGQEKIEEQVYKQAVQLFQDVLHPTGASVSEDVLIDAVLARNPKLSRASVLAAIRRQVKAGNLRRLGKRRSWTILLGDGTPSTASSEPESEPELTLEERILKALAEAYPEGVSKKQLAWKGQDLTKVDTVLHRLIQEKKVGVHDEGLDTGPDYFLVQKPMSEPELMVEELILKALADAGPMGVLKVELVWKEWALKTVNDALDRLLEQRKICACTLGLELAYALSPAWESPQEPPQQQTFGKPMFDDAEKP